MNAPDIFGIIQETAALRELLEHLFTGQGYLIETEQGEDNWVLETDPSPRVVDPRHHTLEAVMARAERIDGNWRIRPRGFFDSEAYRAKVEREQAEETAREAARPNPVERPPAELNPPPPYRPFLCRLGLHIYAPAPERRNATRTEHLRCVRCDKPKVLKR